MLINLVFQMQFNVFIFTLYVCNSVQLKIGNNVYFHIIFSIYNYSYFNLKFY